MTTSTVPEVSDSTWAARGRCRDMDPDGFFVQGAGQQSVKALCADCPVRIECLSDALDNRIEYGVWGGMTERERRRVLREHPQVDNWYVVLDRARTRIGPTGVGPR